MAAGWELGGHLCPLPSLQAVPTLWLCPQLSLRAVNSSRSGFASFLFAPLFFQLYEPGSAGPETELFRCKVHMKVQCPAWAPSEGAPRCSRGPRQVTVPYPSLQSFLGIFRSLPSLEKSVGKCLILLKPRASRLVLQLHCKYGEYQRGHGLGVTWHSGGHAGTVSCPAEPLSPPAARCHQDTQPGLPGVRAAPSRVRHPELRQPPLRPITVRGDTTGVGRVG